MGYNIAIDGPAGAGKSTIAKKVAKDLGFVYVDTGAMYRALAVHFINENVDPVDTSAVVNAVKSAVVAIKYVDGVQHVFLNDNDVTDRLRTEEVGNMASVTSAIPEVRAKLLELQRGLAASEDVIMDGRDIGTNILPNAELKIYLTASVDTRAKRRFDELTEKGAECDLEVIKKDIEDRDYRDMHRETAPLKQAEDAHLVDSSFMNIEEVVDAIKELYNK